MTGPDAGAHADGVAVKRLAAIGDDKVALSKLGLAGRDRPTCASKLWNHRCTQMNADVAGDICVYQRLSAVPVIIIVVPRGGPGFWICRRSRVVSYQ